MVRTATPTAGQTPYPFMALREWRERAFDGEAPRDVLLPKACGITEIRQVGGEHERRIRVVVSTDAVDREDDTLTVDGWALDAYRHNPVVLWAHDYWSPPIARSVSLTSEVGKLISIDEFPDAELHPFAFMLYRLIVAGYINTASVGFRPLEWKFNEERGGIDFLRHEKLEHSFVPVPANSDALVEARSIGIDLEPMREWAERVLDGAHGEPGLWLPRATIERMVKAIDPRTVRLIAATTNDESPMDDASDEGGGQARRAISYGEAHFDGTPMAPEDDPWDGAAEIAAAEVHDLKVIAAWVDDEQESLRDCYQLAHHRADGPHVVVLRAVTTAAARLPQTDLPTGDIPGVEDHLGRHYVEFGRLAPWDQDAAGWRAYCGAVRALGSAATDGTMSALLEQLGFEDEARALRPATEAGDPRDEARYPRAPDAVNNDGSDGAAEPTLEEVKEMLLPVLQRSVQQEMTRFTGRLS